MLPENVTLSKSLCLILKMILRAVSVKSKSSSLSACGSGTKYVVWYGRQYLLSTACACSIVPGAGKILQESRSTHSSSVFSRTVGLVEEDTTVLHIRTSEFEKVNFGNEQSSLSCSHLKIIIWFVAAGGLLAPLTTTSCRAHAHKTRQGRGLTDLTCKDKTNHF